MNVVKHDVHIKMCDRKISPPPAEPVNYVTKLMKLKLKRVTETVRQSVFLCRQISDSYDKGLIPCDAADSERSCNANFIPSNSKFFLIFFILPFVLILNFFLLFIFLYVKILRFFLLFILQNVLKLNFC